MTGLYTYDKYVEDSINVERIKIVTTLNCICFIINNIKIYNRITNYQLTDIYCNTRQLYSYGTLVFVYTFDFVKNIN